jgi:S-adenosylmethionine:tRNA ribosyltransferase-isomerase
LVGEAFFAALHRVGALALPPYIARPEGVTAADAADYQTMFAAHEGAVAAPTAGLHFTPALMAAVEAAGVEVVRVTLHVGAGTFLPVRVENVREHRMHAERGIVSAAAAARMNAARAAGGRVVTVGTTALRLVESAADEAGVVNAFDGETDIFILPGYRFKVADVLFTNFHLPHSTLLMLVSAFAGVERIRAAYRHAIAAGYRFYSYGDACLLERA